MQRPNYHRLPAWFRLGGDFPAFFGSQLGSSILNRDIGPQGARKPRKAIEGSRLVIMLCSGIFHMA